MIHKNLTKQEINKTYQTMLKNNPHFAKFVKDNEFETIEDIAYKYGINLKGKKCTKI